MVAGCLVEYYLLLRKYLHVPYFFLFQINAIVSTIFIFFCLIQFLISFSLFSQFVTTFKRIGVCSEFTYFVFLAILCNLFETYQNNFVVLFIWKMLVIHLMKTILTTLSSIFFNVSFGECVSKLISKE